MKEQDDLTHKAATALADEFDAIALAESRAGLSDRLTSAERYLFERIPHGCASLLDVGCGTGRVTRAAAQRAARAVGVDVSRRMIDVARSSTISLENVEYRVADVMTDVIDEAPFNAVIAINMVHHVQLEAALARLSSLVAPGGVLLIQDVVSRPGLRYLPVNAVADVYSIMRRLRPSQSALAALYASHGDGEVYLTPREARTLYAELLPGSEIHHHVAWRYTASWKRSA